MRPVLHGVRGAGSDETHATSLLPTVVRIVGQYDLISPLAASSHCGASARYSRRQPAVTWLFPRPASTTRTFASISSLIATEPGRFHEASSAPDFALRKRFRSSTLLATTATPSRLRVPGRS